MILSFLSMAPTWTIQAEGGSAAVDFDVFLSVDFSGANTVAHEPVEQGSFADYNKQESPKELTVALACTKMYMSQQPVLETLDKLASGIQKVSLVTPSYEYKNLNLESYSYRRTEDAGAGMLAVELKLVEIREVEVKQKTTASESPKSDGKQGKPIEKSKNPSNDSKAKTGRTQTQTPKKTAAREIGDMFRGWLKG